MSCHVEVRVHDEERFARLVVVVDALKRDKDAGVLAPGPTWRALFDERALAHFWEPTPEERDDWLRRWFATPVADRWNDPSLKNPWDFDSLINAFANGEYVLLGVRRTGDLARIEFEPFAHPYGGTECFVNLAEAFDLEVVDVDDGTRRRG
jgi:hypothetical protein